MAYAIWAQPNKTSGSGNSTVSWSAPVHTGRNARETDAVFSASNCEDKTLHIIQSGKPEFVDIADTATPSQSGGSITISGTSNSSKLTFALTGANGIGLVRPTMYIANSVSTNNGAAITGDPGASAQYTFSITFSNIGENTGLEERVSQLTVTPNEGPSDTCTITQAAGEAYLRLSTYRITIPAAGTATSVSVESNTDWTIS